MLISCLGSRRPTAWEGFRWQEGYAAFTVSHGDVSKVADYIADQEGHHRTVSSGDELRAILTEFGIEIDERYFE
ncbi:MAG: transposase [Armatimonadetes bacterium]|nr:transposase [Armatimonadota bacterium]